MLPRRRQADGLRPGQVGGGPVRSHRGRLRRRGWPAPRRGDAGPLRQPLLRRPSSTPPPTSSSTASASSAVAAVAPTRRRRRAASRSRRILGTWATGSPSPTDLTMASSPSCTHTSGTSPRTKLGSTSTSPVETSSSPSGSPSSSSSPPSKGPLIRPPSAAIQTSSANEPSLLSRLLPSKQSTPCPTTSCCSASQRSRTRPTT